jgi:Cof subfamily protein (haloacid dehalogenase superfamily)
MKMIVFDLDETLLRKDKSISEYTKSILKQCRESGIKIVYATGRGGSAERVAPSSLFDAKITMNGAMVQVDEVIIHNCLIPYNIARPVLVACDQRGLKTASNISSMHYSNFVTSDEWPNITNYKIVDFSKHDIDAEKLYAIVNNIDDVNYIENHLPKDLYVTVSKDNMAQIMHKDATKSKAISELARFWNIAQSQIIAFGDDLNDIDMLSYAGTGIAMENARNEVKAVADFTCQSNEEDGVAKWIAENILNKVIFEK